MIIAAPATEKSEPPISSGPFWPEIDPAEIRDQQRIDNTVTPARLRGALVEAIVTCNHALRAWRLEHEASGTSALADIAADEIDGTSALVHRYQRAVGCLAKAMLLERYRDIDTTGKGDRKAEALAEPIDDYRRDHLNAIADILGRPRITVDLI